MSSISPGGFNSGNADANCDGSIDIVDALLVAQYYVGLLSEFCQVEFLKKNSQAQRHEAALSEIVDALLISQYCVGLIAIPAHGSFLISRRPNTENLRPCGYRYASLQVQVPHTMR